jgi:hypothetical protein
VHGKRRPKAALSPADTGYPEKFSVPSAPAPLASEGHKLFFRSTNILIDLSLRRQQKSLLEESQLNDERKLNGNKYPV